MSISKEAKRTIREMDEWGHDLYVRLKKRHEEKWRLIGQKRLRDRINQFFCKHSLVPAVGVNPKTLMHQIYGQACKKCGKLKLWEDEDGSNKKGQRDNIQE